MHRPGPLRPSAAPELANGPAPVTCIFLVKSAEVRMCVEPREKIGSGQWGSTFFSTGARICFTQKGWPRRSLACQPAPSPPLCGSYSPHAHLLVRSLRAGDGFGPGVALTTLLCDQVVGFLKVKEKKKCQCSQRDITAGKAFATLIAFLGLIPVTLCDPLSPTRSDLPVRSKE